MARLVVLRLVGGEMEGKWIVIPEEAHPLEAYRWDHEQVHTFTCVPTGSVEWRNDDDACAEVYVPETRLALWRAEHVLD